MEKSYKVSTLFTRLRDSEHAWEAHVLDLDVITYGQSLRDAVEAALEAASMVLEDDLEAGREPLNRRAPDEDWAQFKKVQSGATSVKPPRLRTLGEVIKDPETEVSRSYVAVELWVAVTATRLESNMEPSDPVDPAAYEECA